MRAAIGLFFLMLVGCASVFGPPSGDDMTICLQRAARMERVLMAAIKNTKLGHDRVSGTTTEGASTTRRYKYSGDATAYVDSACNTISPWQILMFYRMQAGDIRGLRHNQRLADWQIVDWVINQARRGGLWQAQARDLGSVRSLPWVSDRLIVKTLINLADVRYLNLARIAAERGIK